MNDDAAEAMKALSEIRVDQVPSDIIPQDQMEEAARQDGPGVDTQREMHRDYEMGGRRYYTHEPQTAEERALAADGHAWGEYDAAIDKHIAELNEGAQLTPDGFRADWLPEPQPGIHDFGPREGLEPGRDPGPDACDSGTSACRSGFPADWDDPEREAG